MQLINEKRMVETVLAQLPPDWRKWFIENLNNGCKVETLMNDLNKNGFVIQFNQSANVQANLDESIENTIIDLLLSKHTPYQIAAKYKNDQNILNAAVNIAKSTTFKRLKDSSHQLNKKTWLLNTVDSLAQLSSSYPVIPKIKAPSFQVFIDQYYSQHLPVILTGAIDHWPARSKWNPEYLAETVGDDLVEVQMGRNKHKDFERNSHALKKTISMREYAAMVQNAGTSNDFYMTANNTSSSHALIKSLYEDLGVFGDQYTNAADIGNLSFLWFGPQGTFTPLHHDLTNNMLIQLHGRKKVTLIPAAQVPYIYNDRWVFSEIANPNEVNLQKHPEWKNITPIECILEEGDALFIPIGWWHCVESLDVSISLSFINFNAKNDFSAAFPRSDSE